MDSRARSEKSSPEKLRDTLVALKTTMAATTVGVFDRDRATLYVSTEPSPEVFWQAFSALPCLSVDWPACYRDVGWKDRLSRDCTCIAQHSVDLFLIHGRWILIVLTKGSPTLEGAEATILAELVLFQLLPDVRMRKSGRGGPEPVRAELGIPVSWIRRRS